MILTSRSPASGLSDGAEHEEPLHDEQPWLDIITPPADTVEQSQQLPPGLAPERHLHTHQHLHYLFLGRLLLMLLMKLLPFIWCLNVDWINPENRLNSAK